MTCLYCSRPIKRDPVMEWWYHAKGDRRCWPFRWCMATPSQSELGVR